MPGKANGESGITTLKAETLERTAPHGPLHPAVKPLSAPPQGHQTEPSCHRPGQQPTFYLPMALMAAPNIGTEAKSPGKQLRTEPLGACNISQGPSRVFPALLGGWRAPTLCARASCPAVEPGGRLGSRSFLGPPQSCGMGSTREAHVAGPGPASAADANQAGHVHTARAWGKASAPVARSRGIKAVAYSSSAMCSLRFLSQLGRVCLALSRR